MAKYLIIIVVVFVQAASLASMPRNCFTLAYFATCERVQVTAWANLYNVNWESVDAIRTFKR